MGAAHRLESGGSSQEGREWGQLTVTVESGAAHSDGREWEQLTETVENGGSSQ